MTVLRLIEILFHDYLYNVGTAIKALESGKLVMSDQSIDCNDAFKNIIGTLPLPTRAASSTTSREDDADESGPQTVNTERLDVQGMREERIFDCIRHFIKIHGSVMIDD